MLVTHPAPRFLHAAMLHAWEPDEPAPLDLERWHDDGGACPPADEPEEDCQ